MKSNNALIVILGTVTLDAVGIGLVMPVLPGLLRDIVHSDSIASHYGVLLALYALMQFLCAPVLGHCPTALAAAQSCSLRYLEPLSTTRSWRPHPSCGYPDIVPPFSKTPQDPFRGPKGYASYCSAVAAANSASFRALLAAGSLNVN
jgi:DHA1 family tetracycline resistance protein-like MFS transporter